MPKSKLPTRRLDGVLKRSYFQNTYSIKALPIVALSAMKIPRNDVTIAVKMSGKD